MKFSKAVVALLLFVASASAFPRPNENVQIIESSPASQIDLNEEAAQIQQIPQIEAQPQPMQIIEPVYNPNLPIELNKEMTQAQLPSIIASPAESEMPKISEEIQDMIEDVIQDAIEENAKSAPSVGLEDIEQQFAPQASEQSNRQKRQFGLGSLFGGFGGYGKHLYSHLVDIFSDKSMKRSC